MSQSSLVSYPKALFCDLVVKKTKEYLHKYQEMNDDYRLTMIMQVFDHCSCRLVSKYILKNFLEEEETLEEDLDHLEMEDFGSALTTQERAQRIPSDSSSLVYIDRDFDEAEEADLADKKATRKAGNTLYDVKSIVGLTSSRLDKDTLEAKKVVEVIPYAQ
jgi:hypothetical protein